jgi:dienelactone hydrolase
MESLLLPPPPAPFEPLVIAEEDRGAYVAQKVVLNISGDSRVLGYLLVPKGEGPFPGALLLHDHGAKFDIGKEKLVRPFGEPSERMESSRQWVDRAYGGRYIGDELSRRGYLCFITDALNWGDRGGAGYDGQALLGNNLMHFGMSLAGIIAHEDLRAAEFLAAQPRLDASRVVAIGLSMGSFRTWQVAALSGHITAGIAICWMTTVSGQIVPGNNKTQSPSGTTMTHPGLFWYLDYPDIASLACPKPMLFYAGLKDTLFPIPSVEAAFAKMHKVWKSQNAATHLETRLWDVPHEFNREMQDEAFAWLDRQINR